MLTQKQSTCPSKIPMRCVPTVRATSHTTCRSDTQPSPTLSLVSWHAGLCDVQIGLLRNPNVPDLVPCLLPAGYPASCHRFLRKWILLPPSHRLADSMHTLCRQMASPAQVKAATALTSVATHVRSLCCERDAGCEAFVYVVAFSQCAC